MSENKTEKLVYWYLRFNGYFTIANFTVHPDFKKQPETEADILAVHFPNSKEEPGRDCLERDERIVIPDVTDFVIGEAKAGKCEINENSWGNPQRRHIQYALRWMGFLADDEVENVAKTLYEQRFWNNGIHSVRLVAFGAYRNDELNARYPTLPQILHGDMAAFISKRLTTNCNALHRENWDPFIQKCVELAKLDNSADRLLEWILQKEN